MITEEVKEAFDKVDPAKGMLEFLGKRKEWLTLFHYYNEKNDKKIYPGCRPCFPKVYQFIKMELQNERTPH